MTDKLLIFILLLLFGMIMPMTYDNDSYAEVSKDVNEKQFYGCGIHLYRFLHCDPLQNALESYLLNGTSRLVYTYEGTFADGKSGEALSFGGDRYTAILDDRSLQIEGAFSISAWVKLDVLNSTSRFMYVVDKRESSTKWYQLVYDMSQQKFRFGFHDGDKKTIFTDKADWVVGQWYHIVGTYDPNSDRKNMRIYVDGLLDNQAKRSGNPPAIESNLRIGAGGRLVPTGYWQGDIDELRIYNRPLTENEVAMIFNNQDDPAVSNGLVGHWLFDENLKDNSGNNNHGFIWGILITSMEFAPDGRLFFTEKDTGNIRILKDERVLRKPFVTISDLHVNIEQGMLGLTLDPDFEETHFVYLYYTYTDIRSGNPFNRVVRFTDDNNVGKDDVVLLDKIPANTEGFHAGGALAFGHDEKLYITVGDAGMPESSQDPSMLTGKVLRINSDGTIPADNPFPNSPVYTIGHRNMFGIAFDRTDKIGIVTENGPESYDEINRIEKGGNYGWPTDQPGNILPELSDSSVEPIRSYWLSIVPAQVIFYEGDKITELKGRFVFTSFNSGNLYTIQFDRNSGEIIKEEVIRLAQPPLISIAQSPDGSIYYGASAIYELESVDVSDKDQILFPVEITGSVTIKDLQILPEEKKMMIDMHSKDNSSLVTIKIPTALLDGSLTVGEESEQMSFVVDNSSPGYSIVNVDIRPQTDVKLVIVGTTVIPEFPVDIMIAAIAVGILISIMRIRKVSISPS
ncbi:MAG: PQQ-dependent sugar dehydrogenase [Nitrososphaerales archaeon]